MKIFKIFSVYKYKRIFYFELTDTKIWWISPKFGIQFLTRMVSMYKSIVYVQIHFGKLYVYTLSKIVFLKKDSNFIFHLAFKTWQTSDPPKVVAATFEIFNGLNIHSYVSQPLRLHYYNIHLHNLHWNAHFL